MNVITLELFCNKDSLFYTFGSLGKNWAIIIYIAHEWKISIINSIFENVLLIQRVSVKSHVFYLLLKLYIQYFLRRKFTWKEKRERKKERIFVFVELLQRYSVIASSGIHLDGAILSWWKSRSDVSLTARHKKKKGDCASRNRVRIPRVSLIFWHFTCALNSGEVRRT